MIIAVKYRSVESMFSDIAVTQALGFASLVFTGILSYFMFRAKSASELAVIQANAAAAQAAAAATKVATVAATAEAAVVNAGVAVNKANAMRRENSEGQEARTEMIVGLVTEIAEVKKTGIETHVLVDGQMGRVLDIGLKAARLLAKAEPTKENLADLEAAETAKREHEAKMKIIEAKNAGAK